MKRINTVRTTVYFDDVLIGNKEYSIEADVSGVYTDVGIGPYEFWGMKGTDSKWAIEEFTIDSIEVEELIGDDEVTVEDPATIDKLKDLCYELYGDDILNELEYAGTADDYEGD